ncbi:MAG TPA: hypothetical protein VME69_10675, partial [Methylocella sp.]|nr:hypothetical protein [Methylocella sp.]
MKMLNDGQINRTKMFHVKHFCPIGAENHTRRRTPRGRETRGIVPKIGHIGRWTFKPEVGARTAKPRMKIPT